RARACADASSSRSTAPWRELSRGGEIRRARSGAAFPDAIALLLDHVLTDYFLVAKKGAAGGFEEQRNILRSHDDSFSSQPSCACFGIDLAQEPCERLEVDTQVRQSPCGVELERIAELVPRPRGYSSRGSVGPVDGHEDIDTHPVLMASMRTDASASGPSRLADDEAAPALGLCVHREGRYQRVAHFVVDVLASERRTEERVG